MKTTFAILIGVACVLNVSYAYNFLFTAHSNNGVVGVANDKGKISWSMKADHPQEACVSPDGKKIFVSYSNGATMYSFPEKKELWQYKCPTVLWSGVESDKLKKGDLVTLENPVAQILGDDLFLVGNEGRSMLMEINSQGVVLKSIKTESLNVVKHGEFRLASKTKNGLYMFPLLSSSLLTIYNSDLQQVRRIKTESGVVSAKMLDDGSLILGGLFGIAFYDKNDVKVKGISGEQLQKQLGAKSPIIICDVHVLPNKNLLCTTYGGKEIPDVLEVSQDGKIVKVIDFPEHYFFSALQLLDDNLKPLE